MSRHGTPALNWICRPFRTTYNYCYRKNLNSHRGHTFSKVSIKTIDRGGKRG